MSGQQGITRQYSILSRASTKNYFLLLIKMYEEGEMSRLVAGWQVGAKVSCRGPLGSPPPLDRLVRSSSLVVFCQGSGLVPMVPLISDLLEEEWEGRITMVYSESSASNILLLDRLNELCGFWNFRLKIFLGEGVGPAGKVPQREIILHKLSKEDIQGEVSKEDIQGEVSKEASYLVCGGKQYMKEVVGVLSEAGVGEASLHRF